MALKILIVLLSLVVVPAIDLKRSKESYDAQSRRFIFKIHWLRHKWDDLIVWVVGGVLGALTANEWALPLAERAMGIEEAEGLELTGLAICTILAAKGCEVIVNKLVSLVK